jgi:Ca2+:H+ antiporter
MENDEDEGPSTDFGVLKLRIVENPIKSILFVTVPLGIFSKSLGFSAGAQFWFNFFALIPLSTFLGNATEDLASYTSQIVAGLLNATFGNVVEMMVTFMALMNGELDVVKATLLGSILSNLLFVLGSCFLYGGYKTKELTFCSKAASTCTSLLLLAIVSLVMPTFLKGVHPEEEFLNVSRYSSIVIFFVYLQFLAFQLVTHADYFNPEEEEEGDEPKWTMGFAVAVLALMSVITAFSSDALVDSITEYSKDMSLNRDFIGLILVASVGNIPEFYVTLMVASANKLDLALTIAVGSSCQMALFVTPFCVLAGWILDKDMSLNFHPLQVISMILAVLVVSSVIQGGSATWLQGSLLISSYAIIGMIFFFLPLGESV